MVLASHANNDLLHDVVESSGVLPGSYFECITQCHPLAVRPLKMLDGQPWLLHLGVSLVVCLGSGFNPAGGVTSLPRGGEHAVIHTRQRDETENDRDMSKIVKTLVTLGEIWGKPAPQINELSPFQTRRVLHGHHRRDEIIAAHGVFGS
jgi:hypothetical protein